MPDSRSSEDHGSLHAEVGITVASELVQSGEFNAIETSGDRSNGTWYWSCCWLSVGLGVIQLLKILFECNMFSQIMDVFCLEDKAADHTLDLRGPSTFPHLCSSPISFCAHVIYILGGAVLFFVASWTNFYDAWLVDVRKPEKQSIHGLWVRTPGGMVLVEQKVSDVGKPVNVELSDQHPECAICLDCMCKGDSYCVLNCGHCFHVTCLDKWLQDHSSCPTCRYDVRTSTNFFEDMPGQRKFVIVLLLLTISLIALRVVTIESPVFSMIQGFILLVTLASACHYYL